MPLETLASVGPTPINLEIAEAVARFHLTAKHDFPGVYFHWLGLAADEPTHSAAMPEWNHLWPSAPLHWIR
ncbi:hypothetical protein TNCV_1525111 [Trichonephila clavipes]|nr:hypothetical protein TNCV_1525111 [Trichonephila clavipes]